jgi:hypothetical protein
VWTRQFGTYHVDSPYAAAADSSGVYVGGVTYGAFAGHTGSGNQDAFIRRYSSTGAKLWTRQFGGAEHETLEGLSATAAGLYATGMTESTVFGQNSAGSNDVYAARYTQEGELVWARQFGTPEPEADGGISAAPSGVYITGSTYGVLGGQTGEGGQEAFTRRYVSYRPDALISKSASSGYAGDDIYNDTGNNQGRTAEVARGDKQVFYVRGQNDGDAVDTFTVDGCASTGNFRVTYFRGTTNVTSAVVGGTYRMRDVNPGLAATLRAVVKVAGDTPVGASKACAVTITSTRKPTLSDTVKAVVEARG